MRAPKRLALTGAGTAQDMASLAAAFVAVARPRRVWRTSGFRQDPVALGAGVHRRPPPAVSRFDARHTIVIEAADEVGHRIAGAAPRRMCGDGVRLTSGHSEQHRSPDDMRGRFRMRKADPGKPSSLLGCERAQRVKLATGHEILHNATSDQQLANNSVTRREECLCPWQMTH